MKRKKLDIIDKLEAAMRYVYAHCLEEDESLESFMISHEKYLANTRHAVREVLYRRMAVTLRQIATAESRIDGGSIDPSTIHRSVKRVRYGILTSKGKDEIEALVDEFETYWKELTSGALRKRIRFYNSMPKHVLAVILGMAEEFGWANATQLSGLYQEFKTVNENLVNKI